MQQDKESKQNQSHKEPTRRTRSPEPNGLDPTETPSKHHGVSLGSHEDTEDTETDLIHRRTEEGSPRPLEEPTCR